MNIYIDESGSINNELSRNFVIALIKPLDKEKLKRVFKRFIASNINDLRENSRYPEKMFLDGKFSELKASALTKQQKLKFLEYITREKNFEVYYIILRNQYLSDHFCKNTARAFNYSIFTALQFFISHNMLEIQDECNLLLDERNEKTDAHSFLENYLNTQFIEKSDIHFNVSYHDSSNVQIIQVADFFANIIYSNYTHNGYQAEIQELQKRGFIKGFFYFPYYENN